MKLVIEKSIPFVKGVFEPYCEVKYLDGMDISTEDLRDVDGLIIRTQTKCNAELLEGTAVKMIATAAIGLDHIDLAYCQNHGIHVSNAAGCNAGAVMNYVFSALFGCAARKSRNIMGATLGIIGHGHTGARIEGVARKIGFNVLICDPPRESVEASQLCSLDHLLRNSDIVTMHCSLNDSTRQMCDDEFFGRMGYGAGFINTARGEIVDDEALKRALPKLGSVIIDTWNNEPDIDCSLVESVDIASPHIAGYSYQGKLNGTRLAVRATARFFGFSDLYDFFPTPDIEDMDAVGIDLTGMGQGQLASTFQYNYPIFTDDFIFRTNPKDFKQLRKDYRYRREFFIE